MQYSKAAQVPPVAPGSMVRVAHDGIDILIANVEGTLYAIPDKCPHMGLSLAEGSISNGIITCRHHGAQFDVRTGKAVKNAKMLFREIRVKDSRSIPVRVDGGDILIGKDE